MHLRQALLGQRVEGPLRRLHPAGPFRRARADPALGVQEDVRPVARELLLHGIDDLTSLGRVERAPLLLVHRVVALVAVARVAPAAVLRAGDHRQHEVGVDQRHPVPHRQIEVEVLPVGRGDRVERGARVERALRDRDPDLAEVGLDDLEAAVDAGEVARDDHLVRHLVAVGDADAVRPLLVAERVERPVGEVEVERLWLDGGVVPRAGRGRDDRRRRLRRVEPDDVRDLVAVDGVGHRLLHLRVQELAVVRLLRVRVDDEVVLGDARHLLDGEACPLHGLDRGRRDGLERVELVRLERRDHRVVVRVHLQPESLDVRLRPVEARVALEERDLVLLELGQRERTAGDDRRRVREALEVLALVRGMRRPDVLGQDRELLELRQHVPDRARVVDDQGVRVGRRRVLDVRDEAGGVRGGPALQGDVGVDRPGGVRGGQRLPVRPFRVRPRLERPGLAVLRGVPRGREVGREVELLVVLDEERVDVHEGRVGILVEGHERIERVDPRARPEPEDTALLHVLGRIGRRGRLAAAAGSSQRDDGNRRRGQAQVPHVVPPRTKGSWSTVSVRASASSVHVTPSGSVARCFPWPKGSLYITGTCRGSRCSSSTSSSDFVRGHSGRSSRQSHFSISPTTTPATCSSFPAWLSCVSIPSTYQGGASTSSKKRMQPSISSSHGVPIVCSSSQRQPPTSGAVTRPGAIARTYGSSGVSGHLAGRLAGEHADEPLPGELARLLLTDTDEADAVEGREAGALAERDVERGDVGVADEGLWMLGDDGEVEVRNRLHRPVATL